MEPFEQALAQITNLNHQQSAARRQLLAYLKKIDRRNSRRAKEPRKVADAVMYRGGASASAKGGTG